MATVIFSNAGDTDTAVLKFIWRGLPNVKLVEVNKQTVNAKEIVEQAIEAEHDTLICCGHGSQMGLYNPAGTGYSFLVNRQNYKKIKVNRFIGVWSNILTGWTRRWGRICPYLPQSIGLPNATRMVLE